MRINELNKQDRKEFFIEIVNQSGVDNAISCIKDNDRLSRCLIFCCTRNEQYWRDLINNGYPKVTMSIAEIEAKLNLTPNTLEIKSND